jgi:hypothetical protein
MHISFSYSFKLPSKTKDFATQKKKRKRNVIMLALFFNLFFFSKNREYRDAGQFVVVTGQLKDADEEVALN